MQQEFTVYRTFFALVFILVCLLWLVPQPTLAQDSRQEGAVFSSPLAAPPSGTGTVFINSNTTTYQEAIDTASSRVHLLIRLADDPRDSTRIRTGINDGAPSDWLSIEFASYGIFGWMTDLGSGDGFKTVTVEVMDDAGNVSAPFSDTIRLDTSHGSDYGIAINEDALWTNSTAVTLTMPAQSETAEMQVSGSGGFSGAEWEPYQLYRPWEVTSYGRAAIPRTVYVRFRKIGGDTSHTFQDDIILDQAAPTSSVTLAAHAAAQDAAAIPVQWAGSDEISGIRGFDIQVKVGSGAWQDWLVQTTATDAVYYAQPDSIVSFRSRAADNAGNWEEYPAQADATVTVGNPPGGFRLFLPTTANP